MKTVFDKSTRDEVIARINALDQSKSALWGKMNVNQMAAHNIIWNEWVLGKKQYEYRQEFLGKLFGKLALKSNTKDDKPLGRNMPAGAFAVKDRTGDIDVQKKTWISLIKNYEHYSNDQFIHDFFGKMTKEQIGIFVYKHSDHHLRQFGV